MRRVWYGRVTAGGWDEEAGVSETDVIYGQSNGVCAQGERQR